jgi:hypothetical protein
LIVETGVFDRGLNEGIRSSVNHFGNAVQVYLECDNIQTMCTPSEHPNADKQKLTKYGHIWPEKG